MKRILFFCAAMLAAFACNAQSILILKDGEVIYECSDTRGVEVVFKADPYNGHEYVDLGLSVKWATMNVGATKPEEYGDYFAWGETEPKSTYYWNTSNPQPIGFSGILLAKRQNSFYCTYFLHNRNVADTKSPYPIKRLEVIRWFNQKSMVFNQSLS